MPVNRNALIRFKTIDKCLQNRYRKWTLEDLIDACSDALYEYEGIDKGVSKRTVQADIQMMRSDKLGYNAPIVVVEKKYYTYEDSNYSITNIPLSDQDLNKLTEAVEFMKQFQGFSHFRELDGMVKKLEDHIYAQKTHTRSVIDFEKNELLPGLEYLDTLYQAIIRKKTLKLTYQSFKAREANNFNFHPYLLKEFRNRWFVIGKRHDREGILNLALDRIVDVADGAVPFREMAGFDPDHYFKNVIGVTVSKNQEAEEIILYVSRQHAPYILSKPLHHSQKLIKEDYFGAQISLTVQHNFELEKEILAFGDSVRVISPERLKRRIKSRLVEAVELYNTELSKSGLVRLQRQLEHLGFSILKRVYTTRTIGHIERVLNKKLNGKTLTKRQLFKEIPELKNLLFNNNLKRIIETVDPNAFLTKVIYFDKNVENNWVVNWHQDIPINVKEKREIEGFSNWIKRKGFYSVCPPEKISKGSFTLRIQLNDSSGENGALKVIPGSHKKRLDEKEIGLLVNNSIPKVCEVEAGGILLMKPLLLHASSRSKSMKRRQVIHLEFSSSQLPDGIEWDEREEW